MTEDVGVLVLAAGKGTRMKSDTIKVLHPLMGQPMLAHVLNSAKYLKPEKMVVVVGHQADRVRAALGGWDAEFALQSEQLGTGHAVASAEDCFAGFSGTILILSGDVPLLSPQTMMDFMEAHRQSRVPLSVLTVSLPNPGAYGRIIRNEAGYLQRIVEARDATLEELEINEINAGIYAADAAFLFKAVKSLNTDNDQKEYYLTDIVGKAWEDDLAVAAILCPDPEEVLGINDRLELAEATAIIRSRTNQAWMLAGVSMIDPVNTYIETTVKLARDVVIWPGVNLIGRSVIGRGTLIEAHCWVRDSVIGEGAVLKAGTYLDGAVINDGETVEPAVVRKG